MRNLDELNTYRDISRHVVNYYGTVGDDKMGVFRPISKISGARLQIIATAMEGWDHVSVTVPIINSADRYRTPTWDEMDEVARLFFKEDEVAMQLHVPRGDHINHHPNCLHLWRPWAMPIPTPPKEYV